MMEAEKEEQLLPIRYPSRARAVGECCGGCARSILCCPCEYAGKALLCVVITVIVLVAIPLIVIAILVGTGVTAPAAAAATITCTFNSVATAGTASIWTDPYRGVPALYGRLVVTGTTTTTLAVRYAGGLTAGPLVVGVSDGTFYALAADAPLPADKLTDPTYRAAVLLVTGDPTAQTTRAQAPLTCFSMA